MKSVIALNCPSCGAELSVDEDREYTFCVYCGTKILLKDQNEKTTRHINEADVIRAKTEREIAMQELALKEKARQRDRTRLILYIVWGVVSVLCAVIGYGFGFSSDEDVNVGFCMLGVIGLFSGLFCLISAMNGKDSEKEEGSSTASKSDVEITSSMENWNKKSFSAVSSIFRAGGFQNIQTVPLCDLKTEYDKKNEIVSSVLINGEEEWEEGDEFPADATILILYHSAK